ncbi:MAG TPA: ABC transporter substrate-binding protein [Erysipelotrichaceae bacterium]|jgi:putative ABC transport system substrate-binding protein|nr:ABC transporter substrate-binding protein [Erysipelotrichia bacterium]HPX33201.1 ABC transporter substrate-binding protein [Erysipelotrichaceae bacterium]HQA85681.1 ABC transporter substrate-binding protein [Erysipelotrichaceae bacterium]
MKKLFTLLLSLLLILSLTGCNQKENEKFVIGICQIEAHAALDAATQGFKDAVIAALGKENVVFIDGNAAGDPATCATICNGFVADGVDMILANATPSLQAAAAATTTIPVLGTSVTEYGVALNIENFNGLTGTNISGTSDLAPLDEQAQMILDILPDVKTVGILYSSSEANSVYQVKVVKDYLESKGVTVIEFAFSDSNDIYLVTTQAIEQSDAIYVPTDNKAASCAEIIDSVCRPAGVPVFCGEENPCAVCGVATLSISYYELGVTTGEMAVKILKGEAKIEEMPIEYFANPVKKYNKEICELLGIVVPEDYIAIEK